MSNPVSGYDMSAQLKKAATAAGSAATKAAAELKSKALAVATDQVNSAARNASDVLKSKLGGSLDKVGRIAESAKKIKGLASAFSGGGDGESVGDAATSSMKLINAKLADSMFVALPDQDVLVADAYGLKGNDTLNSVIGKLTGFATDMLSKAGGLKGLGKGLASTALSTLASGGKIDAKALTERVVSTLGGRSGILNSLSDGVKAQLGESIGLPAGIYDKIESVVSGQLLGYNKIDVKSAAGIFDVLGRVTGDAELAKYFDVGAEAQLLATVYREALDIGLPSAIDAMNSKAKSSEAAYYALQSNLVVASRLGEIGTVSLMTDVLGSERVLGDNPGVISELLAAYSFPDGMDANDYGAELTRVDGILKKIDPHWGEYLRGDTWVTDLTVFNGISNDAQTLLSTDSRYAEAIAMAGTYPSMDLIELGKRNYPGLVL